jgi:hypothetical protein
MMEQHQISERRARRLVGLSRDTYRHPPKVDRVTHDLHEKIVETRGPIFVLRQSQRSSRRHCSPAGKSDSHTPRLCRGALVCAIDRPPRRCWVADLPQRQKLCIEPKAPERPPDATDLPPQHAAGSDPGAPQARSLAQAARGSAAVGESPIPYDLTSSALQRSNCYTLKGLLKGAFEASMGRPGYNKYKSRNRMYCASSYHFYGTGQNVSHVAFSMDASL